MRQHRIRMLVICFLTFAAIVALVVAGALSAPVEVLTPLGTAVGLLATAAVDALLVEKRRRTKGEKAIEDDVA